MSKEESKNEMSGSNNPIKPQNGEKDKKNLVTVSVRYQETVVSVDVNLNESVTALLQAAIKATENQSVGKERFQLKLNGSVLDPDKKVNDYPIVDGVSLVLALIAGGGGNK